jgi:TonB-linked SusC/RagA family outer membrane protein
MRRILMLFVLIIGVNQIFAQTRTVTGIITSKEEGIAIPGVNVTIKGTATGTITDLKGFYSLAVEAGNTIVYSFVGIQTVEIEVVDQTVIDVSMELDEKFIDEVVVIGYGTLKKSHLTGSVSKLKNDGWDETTNSRLDQALIGKIAGVQIMNVSSEAGVAPIVRVRGMGSISANASPLVVVDGHPVEDGLSFVNMADVESVEVLKDAASSAIYGSRGANGVIIITTKSGVADKPKYNFKTQYGIRSPYELHDVMSWSEYIELLYKEASLRKEDPSVPAENVNQVTDADRAGYIIENTIRKGESTDWQAEGIRQSAAFRNYQMSISGGNKDLTYYISGNYSTEEGQMFHSTYDKMSLRAKLGGKLSKNVKFNININPSYSNTERPSENFTDFIRFPSWLPVKHNETTAAFARQNPNWSNVSAGDWVQIGHFADQIYTGFMPGDTAAWTSTGLLSPSTSAVQTPKSSLERSNIFQESYRMLNSADLTINLSKGLDFKTSASAYVGYTENATNAMKNATKEGDPSIRSFGSVLNLDLLSENTLNYKRTFGSHEITTLAGFTVQSRENMFRNILGSGFPSDNLSAILGETQVDLGNTYTTSETIRLLSYLGRVNYNYKEKYLISTSLRSDGSSYFSKGNRWSIFPSFSAGWRVSEEEFMKNYSWLSMLKLRSSYGTTGNNRIQNYSYVNLLYGQGTAIGSGTGQTFIGLAPTNDASANYGITWERTFEYNLGMDLGLFDDRISLSAEYYDSKSDQLLFKQSALAFSGYSDYWNNIGKVQNKGFELELSTINLSKNNLSWKSSFNLSINKNTLLELGGEPFQYSYGERGEVYAAIVGQPAIQFFGYKTDGIWLTQGDADAAAAAEIAAGNGVTTVSKYFTAGGLKSVDMNHDGRITPEDRVAIGNPFPKFTWGMSNTIKYKGFDLSIMLQGVQGCSVLNGDANYVENRKIDRNYNENRWVSEMFPGDGKTPYVSNGQNWMLTDYVIEDGSYIALRDLAIGYNLPKKISKMMHISNSRFHVAGQNLLYFMAKGFRGINPEARRTSGDYNSPMIDGYSRGAFPLAKTISMGLEINF